MTTNNIKEEILGELSELNNSLITGHVSGRYLILVGGKKDREWIGGEYEEDEYQYLDEWILMKIISILDKYANAKLEELERWINKNEYCSKCCSPKVYCNKWGESPSAITTSEILSIINNLKTK